MEYVRECWEQAGEAGRMQNLEAIINEGLRVALLE